MNQVSDVLVNALQDVEKAKIPEDLREVAFKEAIRLREEGAPQSASNRAKLAQPHSTAKVSGGDGALTKIATRFGVESGQVAEVFVERDGEVRLAVGTRALSTGKAPATKEIALLIAGARQACEVEEWTSVNVIRDWCKEYGRYDSANFGSAIASMEDLFQFSGKGQKREVKLRQPAWEDAGDIIRRMVGGE
jgi:hypothetical protein